MRKVIKNEITHRIGLVKKDYIEGLDEDACPKDGDEFLNYFWEKEIANCQRCVLSNTRLNVVKWDGVCSADIMIVLEAPSILEDLSAVSFVGPMELRGSRCGKCRNVGECYKSKMLTRVGEWKKKNPKPIVCTPSFTDHNLIKDNFYMRSSGAIFDAILMEWKFNYPRHNWITQYNENNPDNPWKHISPWFITNSTLCFNPDSNKIDSVPREKCRRWLAYQWSACNPKITIAFGRMALRSLMGSEEAAKKIKPNDIIQTKFGPVVYSGHPAAAMYEPNKEIRAFKLAIVKSSLEIALDYCGYSI